MSYDKTLILKIITHIKLELDYAEKRVRLMERFLIPVWQQPKLMDEFKMTISMLAKDLSDGLASSAWSLLSDVEEPVTIHFKMFIQMADQTPEKQILDQPKWNLFLTDSESFLYDLPKLTHIAKTMFEKKLVVFKPDQYQLPLNYIEKISKSIGKMREILSLYESAVSEPIPRDTSVVITEDPFKEEIDHFIEWCRLDHYEKQLEREKRTLKRKKKQSNL